MINKLKMVFRIFFPKKKSIESSLSYSIKNNKKIKHYHIKDGVYYLKLFSGSTVLCRNHNFSDYDVFNQIFNYEEYEIINGLFKLNGFYDNEIIIIDAGANVGYSSLFFLEKHVATKIFGIEPSKENIKIFKSNVDLNNFQDNVFLYQCALSEKQNTFFTINKDFRDGKDWSLSTEENQAGAIEGITINEIINQHQLKVISLLKIDIEGAERFIFKKENDLSFLLITRLIAIEIHDEFDIRADIYAILKANNFFLFESGELTIAINKQFLN